MELKKCSNRRSVMGRLNNLPQGLFETYDRILSKINNPTDGTDTKTFLRWLCFSARPLKLVEIAETVVVDFNTENGPEYSSAHQYWDPQDVLEKCAGLIAESDEGIILFDTTNHIHSEIEDNREREVSPLLRQGIPSFRTPSPSCFTIPPDKQ
jgi:hypothetical protein